MNWRDHLVAALGYHQLGMHQDALDELDRIPEEKRGRLDEWGFRLSILQTMGRWFDGAALARRLIRRFPEAGDLYLVGAYCIRRSEDIEAAFEFLRKGESILADEPCYWFNLGCYHCQLGRLEEARTCVERAIVMDGNYRKMAREDEDLAPLWDR